MESWTCSHVYGPCKGPCSLFSQSRESVTEIRTFPRGGTILPFIPRSRVAHSTHVLLLNRPSTLGYSNTQPFSYSLVTFAGAEVVGERHFPFRLSAFSAPPSSTSLLRTVRDFINEVRHNLTIQRDLSDLLPINFSCTQLPYLSSLKSPLLRWFSCHPSNLCPH